MIEFARTLPTPAAFAVYILLIIIGFICLIKGADWFVEGAASIAKRLGVSPLIIGLTIVAMGTSAPEAAVSISSALKGNAGITMGNVIGSNIMNVLVILGVTSTIAVLSVGKSTIRYEMPFVVLISIVLLVLGYTGGEVVRYEGIILWAFFLVYLAYLFIMSKKGEATVEEVEDNTRPLWFQIIMIIIGAALIVIGADFAVDGATEVARVFNVSERVIGLTIVALGTSLPELVTSVTAARKNEADIAIGNIVGSNVFNILFVVGTTALITPVTFQMDFIVDGIVAVFAAVLLLVGVLRRGKLSRPTGIVMLICYGIYFVYLMLK